LKVPVVPDNLKPKEITKDLWSPEKPKLAVEKKTNVKNPLKSESKIKKPVIDQLPVKQPAKKKIANIPEVRKPEYVPPPKVEKVEVKKPVVKTVIPKKYEKPKARVEDFMRRNVVDEPIYQDIYEEPVQEERYVEKLEYFIEEEVDATINDEFHQYRLNMLDEIKHAKAKSIR